MGNAIVNLEGKNNLSTTVNQASSSIKTMEEKLFDANKKFTKITENSKTLKKKLAELKTVMAQMNLDGLSDTDLFLQMAQQAGAYSDAIGDASQATRQFASDTMSIQAAIGAMQGVAAAGSVATGVMGLFGAENKKVSDALLKVQSAMAILNGVQTISNVLNKDSVLVLKVKQIWRLANAKATAQETVATNANTASEIANTTAVVANTTATKAWNVVKAVSKALFGDFSGLLLVGATALIGYAVATSDATDKEKDHQEELKRTQDQIRKEQETVASAVGDSIAQYKMLQRQYKELSSDHEKKKWAESLSSVLAGMGIEWNNLSSLENAFINNTDNVVEAIRARAKAKANEDLLVSAYKDLYEEENKSVRYRQYHKGDKIDDEDRGSMNSKEGRLSSKAYTDDSANRATQNSLNKERAKKEQRVKEKKANVERIEKNLENEQNNSVQASQKAGLKTNIPTSSSGGSHSPKGGRGKGGGASDPDKNLTPQEKASKEYDALKKKGDEIIKHFNQGIIDEDLFKQEIDRINKEAENKNFKLRFDVEFDEKINADGSKYRIAKQKEYKEEGSYIDKLKENLKVLQKEREQLAMSEDPFDIASLKQNEKLIKQYTKELENYQEKVRILNYEKGSQAERDENKSKLEERLKNENLSDKEKTVIIKQIIEIDKKNEEDDKFRESLIPKKYKDGSLADIQEKISKQEEIINFSVYGSEEYNNAVEKLLELQKEEHTIQVKIDGDMETPLEKAQKATGSLGDAFNDLGGAMTNLSSAFELPELNIAGTIAQAVANMALAFSKASFKTMNPWEWIAFAASGTATLVASIASIKSATSFANGGIFDGRSSIGDMNFARVNSGEMILNHTQQGRLFHLLNGDGGASNNSIANGNVSFHIRGKDLVGVLNNYNSKQSKAR
ncbi:hypothetical protein HDR70_00355 [bacterium]|nr:hypothetical protein [bacterium]